MLRNIQGFCSKIKLILSGQKISHVCGVLHIAILLDIATYFGADQKYRYNKNPLYRKKLAQMSILANDWVIMLTLSLIYQDHNLLKKSPLGQFKEF